MKKITTLAIFMLLAAKAMGNYDFKKLETLNNQVGIGKTSAANKDEQNTQCRIEVDTENNAFRIIMPFSLFDELSISGDAISTASENKSGITLKTDSYDPDKSNLCGDWKKAYDVQDVLEITSVSDNNKLIKINKSFKCWLKRNEISMSCEISSKK